MLEAGAKVLGVLYWQRPDGTIERRTFRQPNLWPNSATSWLLPAGFDRCLPGYTEPDWVEPCAGEVVSLPVPNTRMNTVGKLYNAAGDGPDSYLATASAPVPQGRPLIFSGRWRREGEFPLGHLARVGVNGDSLLPSTCPGCPTTNGRQSSAVWNRLLRPVILS